MVSRELFVEATTLKRYGHRFSAPAINSPTIGLASARRTLILPFKCFATPPNPVIGTISAEVTNCRSILQGWNLCCVGILWKSGMQELHPLTASQSPLWSSHNVHQVQRAKFPPARQRVLGEAHRPTGWLVSAVAAALAWCLRPGCVSAFSVLPALLLDIAGTPGCGSPPNLLYATAPSAAD